MTNKIELKYNKTEF